MIGRTAEERAAQNAIAVTCVCGGWVMLQVLGVSAESDRKGFREAGKMASEGYTVRTPITVAECRKLKPCKHHGDCVTDPEKVRVEQLEIAEAANG